jgi:hypothetical protein
MRPNRRARKNAREGACLPLVLVENEATEGGRYDHWQDVTGQRYQFPNQYKLKIVPGRSFVYYRGSRRAGGTRAIPEYFGCGVIGQVEMDTNANQGSRKVDRKWICGIDHYVPFPRAVPFKVGSVRLEKIPNNLWGVVREIRRTTYENILRHAGISSATFQPMQPMQPMQPAAGNLPDLSSVLPRRTDEPLMMITAPKGRQGLAKGATDVLGRSPHSSTFGRRGEEIVLKHLHSALDKQAAKTLRWISNEGPTPGWDIQYKSTKGLVFIEVKASSSRVFLNVELTANEWAAAKRHRKRYVLYLVTDVTTCDPKVEPVADPFGLVEAGEFRIAPAAWKLARSI